MTQKNKSRSLVLFTLLLFVCCAALPSCAIEGPPKVSSQIRLQRFVLALGDAVVMTKGTELVLEKAPHLMPILDVNEDGKLTVTELMTLDFEDPATLALLFVALEELT